MTLIIFFTLMIDPKILRAWVDTDPRHISKDFEAESREIHPVTCESQILNVKEDLWQCLVKFDYVKHRVKPGVVGR